MEPHISKSADDILEEVRALGGETLVKKVKRSRELEAELVSKIEKAHQEIMDAAKADGLPEALACSAVCGAYSHAYAISIALLGKVVDVKEDARAGLISTAMRSLMNNLNNKFDEVEMLSNDLGGKIKAAATKAGPLPEADE